jgi:parvulin-like peptidyl-prolyl isomerase
MLYTGIGAVVLFALLIIAFGYYRERVAPLHDSVLKVGDREFSAAFLQRRIEADIKAGKVSPSTTLSDAIVSTLQTIETEEVSRQVGRSLGFEVTEAEIDARIRNSLGVGTGTAQDTFAPVYRSDVLRVGLPLSEYRDRFRAELFREKVLDAHIAEVVSPAEMVELHILKLGTEMDANTAKQELDSGKGFLTMAFDRSLDLETKPNGGDAGWTPRGVYPPEVDEVAFSLPAESTSNVIKASDGYYIIMVGRKEVRDVDTQQKARVANARFNREVTAYRDEVGSESDITEDQIAEIARRILRS